MLKEITWEEQNAHTRQTDGVKQFPLERNVMSLLNYSIFFSIVVLHLPVYPNIFI